MSYVSLLLEEGAPITYVSPQLGDKDASITLRVYALCLPDLSKMRLVDVLDDTAPHGPPDGTQWRSALEFKRR